MEAQRAFHVLVRCNLREAGWDHSGQKRRKELARCGRLVKAIYLSAIWSLGERERALQVHEPHKVAIRAATNLVKTVSLDEASKHRAA